MRFQPTRPLRGATRTNIEKTATKINFNPRAPCGARLTPSESTQVLIIISTHAPLAGRDRLECSTPISSINFNPRAPCGARPFISMVKCYHSIFQPTRPLRGATIAGLMHRLSAFDISTHAPLAGRDSKRVQITMHIFAITDKFQMLLHRMPPVRAFCSFLMQENHADFGCEPPK